MEEGKPSSSHPTLRKNRPSPRGTKDKRNWEKEQLKRAIYCSKNPTVKNDLGRAHSDINEGKFIFTFDRNKFMVGRQYAKKYEKSSDHAFFIFPHSNFLLNFSISWSI